MQFLTAVTTIGVGLFSLKKSKNEGQLWPYAVFVAAFVGLKKLKQLIKPTPLPLIPDWKERKEKVKLISEILEWVKSPTSADKSPAHWIREAEVLLDTKFDHLYDKHALVILCPTAGTGQAVYFWEKIVAPVLNAFGMTQFTVVETEYVRHAIEIAASTDLDEFDVIMHFGGDGTAYEIFEGLSKRKDGKSRLDFPMAFFSCGSGNATGSSLNEANPSLAYYGEQSLVDSCLTLAKWNIVPFDLLESELIFMDGTRSTNLSQISVVMGFHADVVIKANAIRWTRLGSRRYDLLGKWQVLWNSSYPIDVSILPAETKSSVSELVDWKTNDEWIEIPGPIQMLFAVNFWCTSPDPRRNKDTVSNGCFYIAHGAGFGRLQMLRMIGVSVWGILWADHDDADLPDGMKIIASKAVRFKLLGPKTDRKRKTMFLDGEFFPKYIDEIRMRSLPSVARVFVSWGSRKKTYIEHM